MQKVLPYVCALVGFMGSGKTTLGRLAAAELGTEFRDLDETIAREQGMTIAQLFATQGETRFREIERQALAAALADLAGGGILATGGGTFADPACNRLLADRHVLTVWLDAPLSAIESRVPRDGSRPLFRDRAELERLYAERQPLYARADLRFDTAATAPAVTAAALARALAAHRSPERGDRA
jgi:shikimate kinase